jgi:hypothetical protein
MIPSVFAGSDTNHLGSSAFIVFIVGCCRGKVKKENRFSGIVVLKISDKWRPAAQQARSKSNMRRSPYARENCRAAQMRLEVCRFFG